MEATYPALVFVECCLGDASQNTGNNSNNYEYKRTPVLRQSDLLWTVSDGQARLLCHHPFSLKKSWPFECVLAAVSFSCGAKRKQKEASTKINEVRVLSQGKQSHRKLTRVTFQHSPLSTNHFFSRASRVPSSCISRTDACIWSTTPGSRSFLCAIEYARGANTFPVSKVKEEPDWRTSNGHPYYVTARERQFLASS